MSLASTATTYATTAGVMTNNKLLPVALNATLIPLHQADPQTVQAVIAWGRKPSFYKAQAYAKKHTLALLSVEDGFLRSLDSGTKSRHGASFVVDDLGMYFDLTCPNRLQELIFETQQTWSDQKHTLSQENICALIDERLSKYNAVLSAPDLTQITDKPVVLVVDQVANDASIVGAGVDDVAFYEMLKTALVQNPDAFIVIKAHPAGMGVLTAMKKLSQSAAAYLDTQLPLEQVGTYAKRLSVVADKANPIALLEQVDKVYTVSSHMGFEALLLGKQVCCFGVNWYAGFGLTDDTALTDNHIYQKVKAHHHALAQKYAVNTTPSIEQLFYASYVAYSRYVNPATHLPCTLSEVITYLSTNREYKQVFHRGILAYDFSKWKVGFVQAFLGFPEVALKVVARPLWTLVLSGDLYGKMEKLHDKNYLPSAIAQGVDYVVWGQHAKQDLLKRLAKFAGDTRSPTVFCMEDGFIRSNGLGASLLEPLSVVVDDLGIYYDATQPSRLERILSQIQLCDRQNARANTLQQLLLTKRVSKYNVGKPNHDLDTLIALTKKHPNSTVHLVVGQVEDDASVRLCGSTIKTNTELLSKVRQDFPKDIIIYKPHPDVEAGLRMGKVAQQVLECANLVAYDTPISDCLQACQVVHTISSQAGFEALIRGLSVVCYGLPFYAGFGLTTDVGQSDVITHAKTRRVRNTPLTLNELIYATLISYPLYRLPKGYGLATPEAVIDYLYGQNGKSPTPRLSTTAKIKRKAKLTAMQIRHNTLKYQQKYQPLDK